MLKKTLIYLGLGPDDEYDSFDDYAPIDAGPESAGVHAASASGNPRPVQAVADRTPGPQSATVRPIAAASRPDPSGSVRVVPSETRPEPAPSSPAPGVETPDPNAPVPPAVRIVDSRAASPHTISPETFNDAQLIGDRFKAAQAVIVNLQHADRDLRRRIVDFASGLCYALGGSMERVADQVYLLVPTDVEVSDADTRRAFE